MERIDARAVLEDCWRPTDAHATTGLFECRWCKHIKGTGHAGRCPFAALQQTLEDNARLEREHATFRASVEAWMEGIEPKLDRIADNVDALAGGDDA